MQDDNALDNLSAEEILRMEVVTLKNEIKRLRKNGLITKGDFRKELDDTVFHYFSNVKPPQHDMALENWKKDFIDHLKKS